MPLPLASHWSFYHADWSLAQQLAWIDAGHAIEPWIGPGAATDQLEARLAGIEEVNRRGLPLRVRISQPEGEVPGPNGEDLSRVESRSDANWLDPGVWYLTGQRMAKSDVWQEIYERCKDISEIVIVSNNEYQPTKTLTDEQVRALFAELITGFTVEMPAWWGKITWGCWNAFPYRNSQGAIAPAMAYPWDRLSLRWGYDCRIGRATDPFMQVNFWRWALADSEAQIELTPWDGVDLYATERYSYTQWLGICRYGLWTMQDGKADRQVVIAPWLRSTALLEAENADQWRATMQAVDEVAGMRDWWDEGQPVPVAIEGKGYAHARKGTDGTWLVLAVAPEGDQEIRVAHPEMGTHTVLATVAGSFYRLASGPYEEIPMTMINLSGSRSVSENARKGDWIGRVTPGPVETSWPHWDAGGAFKLDLRADGADVRVNDPAKIRAFVGTHIPISVKVGEAHQDFLIRIQEREIVEPIPEEPAPEPVEEEPPVVIVEPRTIEAALVVDGVQYAGTLTEVMP